MPTGGSAWGARSELSTGVSGRDTSFVTTDVFIARVRDLALIGRIIDTALVQGATRISNVQFTATNIKDARAAALREATHQARVNAEIMADASGGKLSRLLEITTESPDYYGSRSFSLDESVPVLEGSISGSAPTTIVVPQLRITVTVYGRWAFEPKS
jgi:uncharacterized protein YggE